jgi:hypothetical protein
MPSIAERRSTKTVTKWFREREGWHRERCSSCGGHGMVSSYTLDGSDFLGAEECRSCAGAGMYWRTPRGRHVLHPGGPFC